MANSMCLGIWDELVQPLHDLLLTASVEWKMSLIQCYTQLVVHWMELDWKEQYQDAAAIEQDAAEKKQGAIERLETTFHAISDFTSYISRVASEALVVGTAIGTLIIVAAIAATLTLTLFGMRMMHCTRHRLAACRAFILRNGNDSTGIRATTTTHMSAHADAGGTLPRRVQHAHPRVHALPYRVPLFVDDAQGGAVACAVLAGQVGEQHARLHSNPAHGQWRRYEEAYRTLHDHVNDWPHKQALLKASGLSVKARDQFYRAFRSIYETLFAIGNVSRRAKKTKANLPVELAEYLDKTYAQTGHSLGEIVSITRIPALAPLIRDHWQIMKRELPANTTLDLSKPLSPRAMQAETIQIDETTSITHADYCLLLAAYLEKRGIHGILPFLRVNVSESHFSTLLAKLSSSRRIFDVGSEDLH
ncbi:hypothetical protein SYNPS1DRAFT_30526 [Syncephalis pseudoplumigaleata]|uniref:Uncharacterized protein n=1 Tax=Syncephalis pseudoplumigaleata TaxID=1712513 RepID=A0A4P9YUR1_9FUNG|nr:hypothetical protein SYNPS1DRAFT_30526 [Syncephalis pseudoplumigaleata]|eukprot:RKP23717.1 hypothetical protein SYNPS1DRAFT_30526 [Syncephalis pseudoplumigaleata]